jgi:iron complex outermembrane receptor protein
MVVAASIGVAQAQVLEEVVVTAQKREQKVSDVGISVTAFTGDQLKALNVSSTTQISEQTPGLIVTQFGGGTATVFNVRGAGQLDFDDQQEAPVAVYLDGAYVSFLAGVGFNFFDLDRVEVLRGSQGTLFGRNATAGLVQVISKKPVDHEEGYVEVTDGSYGMRKVEAAFNQPISDTLSARLSYYHESNNGYIENSSGPNGGDINNNSARLQLLYKPTDQLSILFAGRVGIDDSDGQIYSVHAGVTQPNGVVQLVQPYGPVSPSSYVAYCAGLSALNFVPGPAGGTNPASGDCYNGAANNRGPFQASTDAPSYFRRHQYEGTVTVDYTVGPGTLTSVTDYQDFRKQYAEDSDSTPLDLFQYQQTLVASQRSEELRYAATTSWGRYIAGAYLLQIRDRGGALLDAFNTLGISWQNAYQLTTTTYAGFTQVEYNIAPTLTAILGGRWTEDAKRFDIGVTCGFSTVQSFDPTPANCEVLAPLVQGTGLPVTTHNEGNWSGNAEIDWKPAAGQLAYGKVVRGYKAGGFNGGISNLFLASAAHYGPELPLTYEVGAKTQLFDQKARLDISLFYTDYKGFQTFTVVGPNTVVFNTHAKMKGSEIELVLNPWKGWDILLGASLLDAKQLGVEGPGGALDRPMPNAPHLTYNALARYNWALFGGVMAVEADMNYRG